MNVINVIIRFPFYPGTYSEMPYTKKEKYFLQCSKTTLLQITNSYLKYKNRFIIYKMQYKK